MEEKIIIELDGQDYEVKNPTIQNWAMLNLLKDLEEDEDFTLSLVSLSTGIDEDLLRQANFLKVRQAADFLTQYFLEIGDRFYNEFEFKGKEYKFLDLNNMSFGQFVDIDTFLQKDESFKKSNMNELMAMLYMEKDETTYSVDKVNERKELFKELEVKYLQGSLRFFFLLRKRLQENTPFYLKIKWKMKKVLKRLRPSRLYGVGMGLLYSWLAKTLKTSTK
jgi:hypothetical protein